jgi:hypothetical protein
VIEAERPEARSYVNLVCDTKYRLEAEAFGSSGRFVEGFLTLTGAGY